MYYYNQPASGNNSGFVGQVLSSLGQAISGGPTSGAVKAGVSNISTQLNTNGAFTGFIQPSTNTGTTPLAYLTVLFFDERFRFISQSDGGAYQQQVASSVSSSGAPLTLTGMKAPKNGYVYIYVSNQSDQPVYFDDLAITIAQGHLLEENHYYAYGLKIAAISSKKYSTAADGDVKNNYQMQGAFSEMDDDIGWNDFLLRSYDPQVGRWMQQDPYQQFASPYVSMGNDPVNNIDPSGGSVPGAVMEGVQYGKEMATIVISATRTVSGGAKAIRPLLQTLSTGSWIVKAMKALEVLSGFVTTTSGGNHWTGGYNRANGLWDDIQWNGKTYKMLSKADIETMFGQTGAEAENRYEGVAISAFSQKRNKGLDAYRTKEGKLPDAVFKSGLIGSAKVKALDRDIMEVKLLKSGNMLTDDAQQRSFVEDVAASPAGKEQIGSVWYVTAGDNAINLGLRVGGHDFQVNIYQSVAYKDPDDPKRILFSEWTGVSGTPGCINYNNLYSKDGLTPKGPFAASKKFKD